MTFPHMGGPSSLTYNLNFANKDPEGSSKILVKPMLPVEKIFKQDQYTVTFQVDESEDGLRLDRFLQNHLAAFSRHALQKKILSGEVQCLTRSLKASSTVHPGDQIRVTSKRSNQEEETWGTQSIPLTTPTIIYQDENFLAINKPPYMATHPAGKHLFHCATVYFGDLFHQTIQSIHRLDRETSGVLLLGKNAASARELSACFEQGLMRKCYFFIAHNLKQETLPPTFTANERLEMGGQEDDQNGKTRRQIKVKILAANALAGKSACTDFVLLHQENNYVLGLAFPRTGRQHQIRAHAAAHQIPLVGDKIYHLGRAVFERFKDGIATEDDRAAMELPRHALHALALQIPAPFDQTFMAPLPQDFKEWIRAKLTLDLTNLEIKINDVV
ncbi:MAG: RluA family pseudouridine synthase, partial [Bacteriovoracaceae bacterium]|nr:RluA family pseudouridine synthase [Bacteriovoracaceae bacterium]